MSFLEAAFCTITMILDAGCVQFVIADIGSAGVAVALFCLAVIFIGMISFTGAVIGYVTNYISSYIETTNAGTKRLTISGHIVILNWNTRGSEIVNDLLYCKDAQKVVILVSSGKEDIEREINERLADTISRENKDIYDNCEAKTAFGKYLKASKEKFRRTVTVIVREGDVFSSKQLHDISLERAKTAIILGSDINNTICKFEHIERTEQAARGNAQTVKTLMQVSDITASDYSDDNRKIIVEVTDDRTWELVAKIIRAKQVDQKCNIVPIRINQILGQILSQFSIMPELNLAYRELFSNKGSTFFSVRHKHEEDSKFIPEYLSNHKHAIPLTFMESKNQCHCFFSTASAKDILKTSEINRSEYSVKLNKKYWIEQKNVIILGHNSKCRDIMCGFNAFRNEWHYQNSGQEILRVVVVDDQKNLEKMKYYKEYPFVVETVAADIFDKDIIYDAIDRFVSSNDNDTSILILSDDTVLNDDIDSNALSNLVYVQDIINNKKETIPGFDEGSIDVIVEIIDPKHHDIVNSYSINNVVISNRYISKMITQIGEKEALFNFYADILSYDDSASDGYQSKEIYAKKVSRFFEETPAPCTAEELIRAVYNASVDESVPANEQYPTLVLGYVRHNGEMVLFSGNQSAIDVKLNSTDKIIVFSNH